MATVARPRTVQHVAAGAGQLVLLAALSTGVGLGPVGWAAGIGYFGCLCAALSLAARRASVEELGPANLVTLARAVLVGGVTALVADAFGTGHPAAAPLVLTVLAAVALVLDAVDGQVARHGGTVSALGARFDMEVDAFLLLVLAVHVAVPLGPWVLAIGAMRYAFVAAGWLAPWLRSPLPVRYSGKVVAALQGIVLTVASADVLARPATVALVAAALALLAWSFGRDVRWLWHRRHRRHRPRPERPRPVVTGLAGLLVFVALLAPSQVSGWVPGAFPRIPIEALVGTALVLVLPVRARGWVAGGGGAVLGLLTVLKCLDLGFDAVLSRPFDPLTDWSLVASGVEFLTASAGHLVAAGAVVLAVALAGAIVLLMTLAVRRLARLAVRHADGAARVVAALGVVWASCAVLGAQIVPGVPVAAASAAGFADDHAHRFRASLRDRATFAAQLVTDPFGHTPGEKLLSALRGKDVALVIVESYGRSAVQDPGVAAVLDDGTRRLAAAGFAARTGLLTSSTSGGGSWLAHATLLSGLWIDNQQRYRDLEASNRLTLSSAFAKAGWHTVGIMPGVTSAWPEAAFYRYAQVYDASHLGYRGPNFSWATMPDQYTLSTFERLERAVPGHPPVMAEIPLVSSHAPWSPIPKLVSWHDVGDGSVFDTMAAPGAAPDAILSRDPSRVRTDYLSSIRYSLSSLISYVQTYGDPNLVLIFFGDHQPSPIVTGEGAGRDVPITIVAKDHAVLDRIAGWGWQDGLRPGPATPVWRMDAFRDRFLAAFGS